MFSISLLSSFVSIVSIILSSIFWFILSSDNSTALIELIRQNIVEIVKNNIIMLFVLLILLII